jgi:hypothetical protein
VRYVKRPIPPIEAEQYVKPGCLPRGAQQDEHGVYIKRDHGKLYIHLTDWVVTEHAGGQYMIGDKTFQATYEVSQEQ